MPSNNTATDALASKATIFDYEGTLRRLGGDTGLLADLVQVYDEDSSPLLARMASGVEARRGDEVRYAAHSLRGLAANFGATALTDPLLHLEEAAAQGRMDEAPELLQQVQRESARLLATLAPHHR
jgi:HPt (histidine-containing phosphotransfer) domain-containing protein